MVADLVTDGLHHTGLFISPAVKCARADKRDVGAEIPVATAAVDADENSKG